MNITLINLEEFEADNENEYGKKHYSVSRSDNQDGFSNANTDEAIQRQEHGFFDKLLDKFFRKIGSRYDSRITVAEYQPNKNTMGLLSDWVSPSRLAEKMSVLRPFYQMGSRAIEEMVKQHSRFKGL